MPAPTLTGLPRATAATPSSSHQLAWMAAVVILLPLLSWITPMYEATGVLVAPLAPALVLALCATTLLGWRALPAVAVGAALASLGWPLAAPSAMDVLAAMTLLCQAAFTGLLLRRSGRSDDLALDTRPALRRLLAAAIGCGVIGGLSLTFGDIALAIDSSLRPLALGLVRAIADAGSIVLMLPVVMAWTAPPRDRWLARRRLVALPLVALSAVMWVAFVGIDERDRQQALSRFERDAEVVFARTQSLLDAPVQALQALQGAFKSAPESLTAAQFDSVAQAWIKRSLGVGALGWLEISAQLSLAAEAASPPIASTGKEATSTSTSAPAPMARSLVISATEIPRVRHVLGQVPTVAAAASAPARSALELQSTRTSMSRAVGQDGAVASAPLTFGAGPDSRPGFVLLQYLPTKDGGSLRALAFAIVSADALVAPILAARSDGLRACLIDTDARLEQRRLAGPSSCEAGALAEGFFSREAAFDFSGQKWALRVSQPVRTSGGVWLFALPALGGGALLAVLLCGMTGQMQRARHEVQSRREELRHEIDERARSAVVHERVEHALMDAVQVGVAMVDGQGRIQRVNAAFVDLAGANADALHLRSIDDVLADATQGVPGRFTQFIQQAGDTLMHKTVRLRNADGRVIPSLVTLRVLRDEVGRANSVICAVHDVSENLRRQHVEQVLGDVLNLSRGDAHTSTTPMPLSAAPGVARASHLLAIVGKAELANALQQALHDRPELMLRAAASGAQGLISARTESTQLVLLDLDLPDTDGLALMRTLSAERLPVIAMSRDLRPQRIDQAFAAGARAYITLPPEPRELLAMIDDLI